MGLLRHTDDKISLLHIAAMVDQQRINQPLQCMQMALLALRRLIQNLFRKMV